MPYTACIQPEETYLKISISGTMDTFEELFDFAELLNRLGLEYGITRALLDQRRLRKHLDGLDFYRLAESDLTADAAARGVRLACLPNPQDCALARNVETLLHNRSVSYRVFADGKEAVAWLTR